MSYHFWMKRQGQLLLQNFSSLDIEIQIIKNYISVNFGYLFKLMYEESFSITINCLPCANCHSVLFTYSIIKISSITKTFVIRYLLNLALRYSLKMLFLFYQFFHILFLFKKKSHEKYFRLCSLHVNLHVGMNAYWLFLVLVC